MNFGGPVWHVSIKHPSLVNARAIAFRELQGVGDPALGQWEEERNVFHLRRRLSTDEQKIIGPALDIRGTKEAYRRWKALPSKIRKMVEPF